MVVTWVVMAETIQGLQEGWPKPWFITWVIHAGYSLALLPWVALRRWRTGRWPCATWRCCGRSGSPAGGGGDDDDAALPITMRQQLALSAVLQVLSAFNGLSWYISLPATLVAANNTIYQAASALVFLLSVPVLGERVRWNKVAAVVVSIAGVAMVSFAPTSSGSGGSAAHETVAGYVWVIASTAGYAVYEVVYARFTEQRVASWGDVFRGGFVGSHVAAEDAAHAVDQGEGVSAGGHAPSRPASPRLGADAVEDTRSLLSPTGGEAEVAVAAAAAPAAHPVVAGPMVRAEVSAFMLGMMGVWTAVTLWPLFLVFHYAGVETLVWPDERRGRLLTLSVVLDTLYNGALLLGISWTNPLWISVGTVLVVPGSLLADWLIHHSTVATAAAGGMVAILIGFALLQLPLRLVARVEASCAACWRRGRDGGKGAATSAARSG